MEMVWIFVSVRLSIAMGVLLLVAIRGLCKFDDFFHNISGATFGVGIIIVIAQLNEKYHKI